MWVVNNDSTFLILNVIFKPQIITSMTRVMIECIPKYVLKVYIDYVISGRNELHWIFLNDIDKETKH